MPHYIDQEKNKTPTLVYEAPVDEKTKEIRKMFDVDEETGYPRKYNWRPLAQLGPNYRPEKVFEVFKPYTFEQRLSTHLGCAFGMAVGVGVVHFLNQVVTARRLYSRPTFAIGLYILGQGLVSAYIEIKHVRDQLKYEIYADYMKKHPERFETVHRPKLREALFHYSPCR